MSNIITDKIKLILSQFTIKSLNLTLVDCLQSITERDQKHYISLQCNREYLAEYEELIKLAQDQLDNNGINCQIYLTNNEPSKLLNDKRTSIKNVAKIIVVASGKGGVGKSAIALNLAISLAQANKKVGLIDADIYGPSLTALTGISHKPILKDNLMIPHKKFDVKMMSVGFLMDEKEALIWRGPMITKMLYQLMQLTNWGYDNQNLDYLIVDTPPGTGDIHLSLAENYYVDGAIIVSTPQELVTADVKRALMMFKKLNIPILGLIENFSYYISEKGKKQYIFGKSNINEKLAKKFKSVLISRIPLNSHFNEACNKAKPLTYYKPKHSISILFKDIITNLELK